MSNKNMSIAKSNPKQKKKNKIIAISIIAVAIVSFIAVLIIYLLGGYDGVIGTKNGKYEPIKSSKEESKVIGKIGGFNVKHEELEYVTFIVKERYEKEYGADVWKNPESAAKYKQQLEADVISELCDIYATLAICEELGIKTSSKDANSYVDAQMAEIIDKDFGGSVEKYKEYLEKYNLTDAFNRFKMKCYYLDLEIVDKMAEEGHDCMKYSDKDVNAFIDYVVNENDFYRTIHVYFEKGENDAEVKKEVDALLADLKAMESDEDRYERMCYFIGHRGDYRDGYVTDTKAGFYITDGVFGTEYDTASREIKNYDVTVAETEYEYFLIMKMPKEREQVSKNLDKLLAYYYEKAYFDYRATVAKNLEFKPNKYYNSLDITNIG